MIDQRAKLVKRPPRPASILRPVQRRCWNGRMRALFLALGPASGRVRRVNRFRSTVVGDSGRTGSQIAYQSTHLHKPLERRIVSRQPDVKPAGALHKSRRSTDERKTYRLEPLRLQGAGRRMVRVTHDPHPGYPDIRVRVLAILPRCCGNRCSRSIQLPMLARGRGRPRKPRRRSRMTAAIAPVHRYVSSTHRE